MRVLGIDYGEKRIGLAYTDEIGVAVPLPAATASTIEARIAQICSTAQQRRIETLVFGYPFNMDGSAGFKAKEVDRFIERLTARLPLPVHKVDERLTSHQVESQMRQAGRKLKKARELRKSGDVDSRAAALILQDFIDMHPEIWGTSGGLEPDDDFDVR